LLDALGIERAHFVGTSIGGVVGQALLLQAPERLDQVVLTNTGATISQHEAWHQRAQRVRSECLVNMAAELVARRSAAALQGGRGMSAAGWQTQLCRCDDEPYARRCDLLAETDFRGQLAAGGQQIQLLAGGDDVSTPPAT